MSKKATTPDRLDSRKKSRDPSHWVRLPGFLIEEEIGLGDAIKRATYAMGIKPCGGCERRAAALNRWVHFTR
jgi:hypothetical protein